MIGCIVAVPKFVENINGNFCSFFSAKASKAKTKRTSERMDEIEVYGNSFRYERNGSVEFVVNLNDRDFPDFELYAELQYEEFVQGCMYAFNKRNTCAWIQSSIKICLYGAVFFE